MSMITLLFRKQQASCKLLLETHEGENISDLISGQSYARKKGVEHNTVNINAYEFVFVEIELK